MGIRGVLVRDRDGTEGDVAVVGGAVCGFENGRRADGVVVVPVVVGDALDRVEKAGVEGEQVDPEGAGKGSPEQGAVDLERGCAW